MSTVRPRPPVGSPNAIDTPRAIGMQFTCMNQWAFAMPLLDGLQWNAQGILQRNVETTEGMETMPGQSSGT